MDDLEIRSVENGFVIIEGVGEIRHSVSRMWAFESAETLAVFIEDWGKGKTKPIVKADVPQL